ncbi:MAG: DUF805 domain-containing protein [Alphaproteobacteria bacterium HGW-Alphaproteobacteria-14]|nr:MAG: DUF805 domain-containing protein [Alphaproteobacteria bacterium HGW-Alphaproteobacteria-14]
MEWMILPFKRYADFQGRSRRKEYWMFALLNLLVALVLAGPFFFSFISASIAAAGEANAEAAAMEAMMEGGMGLSVVGVVIYGLYALAAFIPSIAVTVRRLHDRDMSGWWYLGLAVGGLLPFVGFLASIALLVLMVLPGTAGPNRFGHDPKDPYAEDVFA